jgi:hypothetical protein
VNVRAASLELFFRARDSRSQNQLHAIGGVAAVCAFLLTFQNEFGVADGVPSTFSAGFAECLLILVPMICGIG